MTKFRWCGLAIAFALVMAAGAGTPRSLPHARTYGGQALPLPPPRPSLESPPESVRPEPPPQKPAEITPAMAAPPSTQPAPPPAADCLQRLRDRGVTAEARTPAAFADPRCVVDQPITLTSLTSGGTRIDFPDRPLIACATAETLADFVNQFLVPLAKGSYGQPITAIGTGAGLECRPRNNVAGAKLSAHAQGLAIDIAQFRLGDGRLYRVGTPEDQHDRDFDRAVRAGACGYFHTALGPGADPSHANHWHMDLEPRGSNGTSRFCQ